MAKGRERSVKWYFKNEKEVMADLGLTPTKGSGSGWIDKEDGENDFILAQLKSTDKASYTLKQFDLERLEYNAAVSNKIPIFIIQFLNKDARYALVALDDIPSIAEYIKVGEVTKASEGLIYNPEEQTDPSPKVVKPKIKSSSKAKNKYYQDKQKAWEDNKYKGKNG